MHTLQHTDFPVINIAKTVASVASLTNPYARTIMDRAADIDRAFVDAIIGQSIFSWEGRNPRPALDKNGAFRGTDLDLLSFMVPMVARGAVIEIPQYRNRRKVVRKDGERKVGGVQFGQVTGLISNKDVFSFSVRIFDRSIVVRDPITEKESVGAHRNYMLVDCDGYWYDGWNKIVWDPTRAENAFLTEKGLWTDNAVVFTQYVHPARRQSIFGAPYLLLKMLSARLSDEASYYRREMVRLEGLGYTLPPGEKAAYVPPMFEGETQKLKVKTMEVVLDMPEMQGVYPVVEDSVEGLIKAYRRQKLLTYTLRPLVQFVVRADEAAYFRYGLAERFIAKWVKGITWEDGYVPPKGRVAWSRLAFLPTFVLRYRAKEVTEEVSAQ